jgi:hypothetical protein
VARHIVLTASILFLTVASAQEPKSIKTVKVTQSLNDTALYEVKNDGTILIDWDEVEALAVSKQNPILTPQAQVMLAIRELCAIALAICGASPALAETIIGQASIIDDDTLEIRGQRIRLSGISKRQKIPKVRS